MKGTTNIYNTQPLLNEIENVVKNGLDKILAKYLERYELLERTHQQLMKLPSIREEIDKDSDDSDSDDSNDSDDYAPIVNKKQNSDIQRQVENILSYQTNADLDIIKLETKLNSLEKKYAGIYPMLDKILDKIETLNSDVQKMKVVGINVSAPAPVPVTLSVASASENIQLEIKEESEGEEEEESEEDTEGVEEEEDNEGVEVVETKTIKIDEPVININAVCEEVKIIKLESEATVKSEAVENVEEEEDVEGVEEDEEEEDTEGVEEASVETETKSETEEEDEDEDTESIKEEVAAAAEDTEGVEEENLEVITIDDVDYCTNDEENGFIWELTEDGEQGDKVGYIKDGEPFFYADEN